MSNRRRRRPDRRRIAETGIEMSRDLRGCTCRATVAQRHRGRTIVAVIHHEPACPARDAAGYAAWSDR